MKLKTSKTKSVLIQLFMKPDQKQFVAKTTLAETMILFNLET